MIRLNCFLKVQPENKNKVVETAKALVEASLKQDGCIAYDFFESTTRNDVLMFCETWRDQAALDAHAASEAFIKGAGELSNYGELKIEKFIF